MKKQSNLSRLLGYAGGYKYLTVTSWVLSALSSLISLIPLVYIWLIIKEVLETAPNFGDAENLISYGLWAVAFAALAILVYVGGLMCSHLSAFRIAANIRRDCIRHIVSLPPVETDKFGSGKLRKIVNETGASVETYLAHRLPDKAGAIATPIGLLAMLFAFDLRLGILSLLPVVLAFLIMMSMTGSKLAEKMKEYQNSLDDMTNEAVEYVRGIPVVKAFGQTVFSFKRFKASIDNYEKWVISYTKDLRLPMMFYTVAVNSVFAFLIAGGLYFTRDNISSEFLLNLIYYIIITPVISVTLTKVMYLSEDSMIVKDALARMDSVLDIEPLPEKTNPVFPEDFSIEIKNAVFSYDGKTNALDGISVNIKPGGSVALVGPSGGGKTTLACATARFFDLNNGSIKIGGVDIRDFPKKQLNNTVAFVFQNSRLLKASVLENVRMSKPEATRQEVMDALSAAQCDDIIKKLPKGIDTIIGADGVYLSGGEQQRIAIARIMLKDAPIVILDEATAFADPDNEAAVQKAFSILMKNKTVIMIAHRLSTVVNTDRIFVLKDGIIAESGSHNELIEKHGLYSKMWDNYQKSVMWKVGKEETA